MEEHRRFPDSLHEQLKKLKLENESLKEIIEEELNLPKGRLQERIKERIKAK